MRELQDQKIGRVVFHWLLFIAVLLLMLSVLIHMIRQKIRVEDYSMYPVLEEGDQVVVDRISYRFRKPSRNEIVIFTSQYSNGSRFMRRIIALPGETVQILNGKIYVNQELQEQEENNELISRPGLAARPVTLGENEYFVLSENREDSSDSREPAIGNVRLETIEGRVLLRIWPLTRIGVVK